MPPDSSTRRRVLLALLLTALAIAGCGGEGSGGGYRDRGGGGETATEPTAAPNPEEGAVFVSLASVPGFGLVLVDSSGRTLYGFDRDRGGASSCYGPCAETWPPLLGDEPHPSNGAAAAKLGTAARRDGAVQVTYAGHPLYTYSGDEAPGEASGDGASSFGGSWFALKASGQPAR